MSNITGKGRPTTKTVGTVGDIYVNSLTGDEYKCVAVHEISGDKITKYYSWTEVRQNASSGSGGVSPTVDVVSITGGHRVTITDINGKKTFDVMNGTGGSITSTHDGEGNVTIN